MGVSGTLPPIGRLPISVATTLDSGIFCICTCYLGQGLLGYVTHYYRTTLNSYKHSTQTSPSSTINRGPNMCEFYSKADPILYESRTRTVRIDGVVTSIRLENFVWEILARIAEDESSSTNALITTLHREVMQANGETPNFASFLRVTCLRYLNRKLQGGSADSEASESSLGSFSRSNMGPLDGVTRQ